MFYLFVYLYLRIFMGLFYLLGGPTDYMIAWDPADFFFKGDWRNENSELNNEILIYQF